MDTLKKIEKEKQKLEGLKTQNVLQMNANDLCEDKEDLFNTSDEQIRDSSQPFQ